MPTHADKPMDVMTDWSTAAIVARREKFYSASQRKFVPYKAPLIIKKGSGQYLWDENGKRYIDLLAMNLCISVGHADPVVNRAAHEQAGLLCHCTTMFYHPVPAHLAEELGALMPRGHDWVVHFTNSGGEAVDLALMMARSHSGHSDFISLRSSYHGPTFGAQSLSGISGFRHDVGLLGGVQFTPEPNQYRGAFGEGVAPYLEELDRTIYYATTGRLAGIIIEPLQGYGGIVPIPEGYISGAFKRVRAAGGVCIIDEIQSGFARTGNHFWGFEAHGVVPDIVVMAKGMGNGYPIAAVVAKRAVAEAMSDKFLFHTYGANPISCAAARAVLHVIETRQLKENARAVGGYFLDGLKSLQQSHEVIGDVRGEGLMLAIELVKDRGTKEPAISETAIVFEETRHQGLVLSKSGPYRSVLRMVPPLCLQKEDVELAIEALDHCFAALAKS